MRAPLRLLALAGLAIPLAACVVVPAPPPPPPAYYGSGATTGALLGGLIGAAVDQANADRYYAQPPYPGWSSGRRGWVEP